ncbi:hypothetical protein J42TS3_51250 [Paenibacillus vini]|uniref:Uncharacterized protein n=1 Tax=Paenibacillus vini TaxID=1476024 RepID=A0ABQ4MJC4_9BACL|nr:hypothetical protein J42TS3_51250 [Paenibacillus vini]
MAQIRFAEFVTCKGQANAPPTRSRAQRGAQVRSKHSGAHPCAQPDAALMRGVAAHARLAGGGGRARVRAATHIVRAAARLEQLQQR